MTIFDKTAVEALPRKPGFCVHYSKDWSTQKRSCAVGMNPDAMQDNELWLPRHFLHCIPDASVKCAKRVEFSIIRKESP